MAEQSSLKVVLALKLFFPMRNLGKMLVTLCKKIKCAEILKILNVSFLNEKLK
jgi:hypothetical protein